MSNKQQRPRMIVAEVSKRYVKGVDDDSGVIAARFELVIAANAERGYRLRDWKLVAVATDPLSIYETIVAVFEDART